MKNPITKLSELFSNLIVEHGSAVVQEKHISLLKEQFALLTQKIIELQSENEVLKTKNQALESENIDLKKKMVIYEQKNKPFFHANLLWLPSVEQPYCPTCYDSENKLIHMLPWDSPYSDTNGKIRTKPALKCPKCNHAADIAEHPKPKTS